MGLRKMPKTGEQNQNDRDYVLASSFKPLDPAITEAAPFLDFSVTRVIELDFCQL